MNNNLTDITVVLDRSSSMSSVAGKTIEGFNSFLDTQKSAQGSANITLVQFNTSYDVVIPTSDIQKAPPLTTRTFIPSGTTALLDAVGRAVTETGARLAAMPESERPGKVVFVALTDGEENSSSEWTWEKVSALITQQEKQYAWEFVFLGANIDAIATGAKLGVKGVNSMTYAHTDSGTTKAFASVGNNLKAFRGGMKCDVSYTMEDRAEQDKELHAT